MTEPASPAERVWRSRQSHHTVTRYVQLREAGGLSDQAAPRPHLIDPLLPEVE
jgi:hypothetical protein